MIIKKYSLIVLLLLLPFASFGQNFVEAKHYLADCGWDIQKGDTLFPGKPSKLQNEYKYILLHKKGYSDPVTFFIVKQILKYENGKVWLSVSDLKSNKYYNCDIENAIGAGEIYVPDDKISNKDIKDYSIDEAYLASNGVLYKVGGKVKIGMGSTPNGGFKYLTDGGLATVLTYNSYKGEDQFNGGKFNANTEVRILAIKRDKWKGNTKVRFVVGGAAIGNNWLYIEEAIAVCEVIPCSSSKNQSEFSVADEIKKLKDLKDSGAITDEEYQHQKKKILSK